MRKKEKWMVIGATVFIDDKIGTITEIQENTINGVDYVYYIFVKTDRPYGTPWHPSDIKEFKPATV